MTTLQDFSNTDLQDDANVIDGIDGKKPAEIAIAVAAELLQTSEARCRKASDGEDLPDNVRFLHRQA